MKDLWVYSPVLPREGVKFYVKKLRLVKCGGGVDIKLGGNWGDTKRSSVHLLLYCKLITDFSFGGTDFYPTN